MTFVNLRVLCVPLPFLPQNIALLEEYFDVASALRWGIKDTSSIF
ncbi:hypothetical protein GPEL0_01r4739 [Geoanaerobacter pelophilus]|uniref:Uncharacterized protein n=1 Tax=Geoanaerobacter pelophilus TaxID=60036 RepID=A0ABQ0MMU5_9BACT|nr:hypothetical protein GPEL0_01r4739 [Geoanaerobacter pelophilus]